MLIPNYAARWQGHLCEQRAEIEAGSAKATSECVMNGSVFCSSLCRHKQHAKLCCMSLIWNRTLQWWNLNLLYIRPCSRALLWISAVEHLSVHPFVFISPEYEVIETPHLVKILALVCVTSPISSRNGNYQGHTGQLNMLIGLVQWPTRATQVQFFLGLNEHHL